MEVLEVLLGFFFEKLIWGNKLKTTVANILNSIQLIFNYNRITLRVGLKSFHIYHCYGRADKRTLRRSTLVYTFADDTVLVDDTKKDIGRK